MVTRANQHLALPPIPPGLCAGAAPSVIADHLTTLYDANVQVHLPLETHSTLIEAYTVHLLLDLLRLPRSTFTGTLTTGATGSNVLGLACAREDVLGRAMRRRGYAGDGEDFSLAEEGWGWTPSDADGEGEPQDDVPVAPVNVFVAMPHASIKKAAALLGIGRKRVFDVGHKVAVDADVAADGDARIAASMSVLDFDLAVLEARLAAAHTRKEGAVIVAGLGEVNTGALTAQLPALRQLADEYSAWLHVDAAFSAFSCLLPDFEWVSEHLALADSITSDGHKQLNVPYDCGLFFVRKKQQQGAGVGVGAGRVAAEAEQREDSLLEDVCGPGRGPVPSYLAAPGGAKPSAAGGAGGAPDAHAAAIEAKRDYIAHLPSPLFRNIENSRRFRALPLYATLLCE